MSPVGILKLTFALCIFFLNPKKANVFEHGNSFKRIRERGPKLSRRNSKTEEIIKKEQSGKKASSGLYVS